MEAHIFVNCNSKLGEISSLLYGAGFEHLGGAVELGLSAEMLEGRSFREEDVNQDGISDKWLPVRHGVNTARFSHDALHPFHSNYSQKIEILSYINGKCGIKQRGLYIEAGRKYLVSLYLRQKGFEPSSKIFVILGSGSKVYASATIDKLSSDWIKHTVTLIPNTTTTKAEILIALAGKGAVWIDQVSLIPRDISLISRTRKDILDKILSLKPTCIRWPGGWFSEAYHWRDGIGDCDRRPLSRKYYSNAVEKNNPSWEDNRFGTDEFLEFCRDVEAAPIFTLNIGVEGGEGYLQEAIDWIEYCNGKAHGQGPCRVQYWEVGNEPWHIDPELYANTFVRFAEAIRNRNPFVKLIAAGGNGYDMDWNRRIAEIAGNHMDYLDLHHYFSSTSFLETMADPSNYGDFLDKLNKVLSSLVPDKSIKLSVMEWNSNTNWKDAGRLKEGLYAASLFNVLEKRAGFVEHSIPWPFLRRVQLPGNHVSDHGLIWYDNHRIFLSSTALAFQLYRWNYASDLLFSDVKCASFNAGNRKEVPYLDVVATSDRQKRIIILKVVNKHPEDSIRTSIILSGLPDGESILDCTASVLTAENIDAKNCLDSPNDVYIEESRPENPGKDFMYTFTPHSATVIRLMLSLS